MVKEKTTKVTVTRRGARLDGKELPLGSEHELTDKQLEILSGKVSNSETGASSHLADRKLKDAEARVLALASENDQLKKANAELAKKLEDSKGSEELANQVKQLELELKKANAELAKAK